MTSEILFPTNIVVINFEDFCVILFKILEINPSLFFSNSMCNLLADTKAISIPEKNAENTIEMTIMAISISIEERV